MRAYYLEGDNIEWLIGVCLILLLSVLLVLWPCLLSLKRLICESAGLMYFSLVRLWQWLRLSYLSSLPVGHSRWMSWKPGALEKRL